MSFDWSTRPTSCSPAPRAQSAYHGPSLRRAPGRPGATRSIAECSACIFRRADFFCDAPERELRRIQAGSLAAVYPARAILFVEGEPGRGVFIVCRGRVKLVANSREGRTIVVQIAEAGEAIGVAAAISGGAHAVTAVTMESSQLVFVRRSDFLALAKSDTVIAKRTLVQLSREVRDLARRMRCLGLGESVRKRLITFLRMCGRRRGVPADGGVRLQRMETHETIAQMIGASRPTVTRELGNLVRRRSIEYRGSGLLLRSADGRAGAPPIGREDPPAQQAGPRMRGDTGERRTDSESSREHDALRSNFSAAE